MSRGICTWPGCDAPEYARGLCRKGYNRVRYLGWADHDSSPNRPHDWAKKKNRKCSWPGCDQPHSANGLCRRGYKRVHELGWIDHDTSPNVNVILPCSWPSCNEPSRARGLCAVGYQRVHGLGWLDHETMPAERPERVESTTLYLLLHLEWDAIKIGIGNSNRQREHERHGWGVIETWHFSTRVDVMAAEDRVLRLWDSHRPYLTPERMPQCGWTETIHINHYDEDAVFAAVAA